ncbi:MAG: helicase RepA family protein [Halothiobacillaceae bacterium]
MATIKIPEVYEVEPRPLDFVLPSVLTGTVASLVSPGGSGKTMWALQVAHQVAGAADLLGIGTFPAGPVLYLAAEDPQLAIEHRLFAMGSRLDAATRGLMGERLTVQALIGHSPDIMDGRWYDAIEKAASGCRLVIFDTLRRFHTLEENDSGDMARVVGRLEKLATSAGCAVLFLHHSSKAMAIAGRGDEQQAGRGSSVLIDNIRGGFFMSGMTKEDAARLSEDGRHAIGDRRGYFVRWGGTKPNYGPPISEIWYRRTAGGVLEPVGLMEVANGGRKGKEGRRRDEI